MAGDAFCCSAERRKTKLLLVTWIDTFSQKLNKVNGICENTWAARGLLFFCTLALLGYKSELWCGHEGSDLTAHGHPLYQLSEGK